MRREAPHEARGERREPFIRTGVLYNGQIEFARFNLCKKYPCKQIFFALVIEKLRSRARSAPTFIIYNNIVRRSCTSARPYAGSNNNKSSKGSRLSPRASNLSNRIKERIAMCYPFFYSVRSATTGSFFAAARDGMKPDMSVKTTLIPISINAYWKGRTAERFPIPVSVCSIRLIGSKNK